MKNSTRDKLGRTGIILLSVLLILTGVAHLITGSFGWRNYWGGLVFSPFAIFFGLLLIYVAVFRWRKLRERPKFKKGRGNYSILGDWRKW